MSHNNLVPIEKKGRTFYKDCMCVFSCHTAVDNVVPQLDCVTASLAEKYGVHQRVRKEKRVGSHSRESLIHSG